MTASSQPWPLVAHAGAGPAPEPVVAALSRVLHDMQSPHPVPVGIGWTANDDGTSTLWIQELGDLSLTGIPVFLTDPEELVEQLADQLQEQFFPETSQAWGQPRPPCTGHTHPAEVALRSGKAWWRCPASGNWISKVGRLNTHATP